MWVLIAHAADRAERREYRGNHGTDARRRQQYTRIATAMRRATDR